MNKSKPELKKIMQAALYSNYGFAPALSAIVLLEASRDGAYILATVNKNEYRFDSFQCADGSVFAGKNTITKI